MVLNATQPSIVAFPSLPRQDRSLRTSYRQNYSWDVTVESDGSVLDEGQYRLQVKSSLNSSKVLYHPDIHVVRLGRLFPMKEDVFLLPELIGDDSGLHDQILAGVAGFILDQLSSKRPAMEQMALMR